jgi:hypothetical protein
MFWQSSQPNKFIKQMSNTSQSSFEIRISKDLFLKLVREHERIMADLWSSDHAINFSITAHHLYKDWLKRELAEVDYLKVKTQVETVLTIESGVLRDVCDGTKHLHIDRPPHVQVSNSGMKQGAFSKAFSRAFDIGNLLLVLHDGSKIYFDNVADKVLRFWRDYFDNTNKP